MAFISSARSGWCDGSKLEIYSHGLKKWCHGEVTDIVTDTDGDWLDIEYVGRYKRIHRLSKEIRPLKIRGIKRKRSNTSTSKRKKSKKDDFASLKKLLELPLDELNGKYDFFYDGSRLKYERELSGILYKPPPRGTFKIGALVDECINFEWPIGFHGTSHHDLPLILEEGLKIRGGGNCTKRKTKAAKGEGIYLTPDIALAASYGSKVMYKEKEYRCVLMVRAKPMKILERGVIGIEGAQGNVWLIKNEYDIFVTAIILVPEMGAIPCKS